MGSFLKTDNDAVIEIINHIKSMEVLKDKKVKELRSDKGIEFKNNTMDEFCT